MARNTLAPLTFAVVYFTQCNAPISVGRIEARDYWAACKAAWKEVRRARNRKQIADFQLIDDPLVLAAGPQHIRAAAVEILTRRDAERRAAA